MSDQTYSFFFLGAKHNVLHDIYADNVEIVSSISKGTIKYTWVSNTLHLSRPGL